MSTGKKDSKRKISRRRFVQAVAVGAAGLTLQLSSACDSKSTSSSVTPTTGAPAATPSKQATAQPTPQPTVQSPVKGGTLRIVQPGDLTPKTAIHSPSANNYYLLGGVYEKLLHYRSDKLEAEPELAESWQFAADFKSLTIKLRKGVKFHSGRAFSSQDVKWNIEKVTDPKTASPSMNLAKMVEKIETPDDLTLVLRFPQPTPSILDLFEGLYLADPETYQDASDGKKFIGTGPFVFKGWTTGDHFNLARNPDYWQKDRPYLDEVVVTVLPDSQAQFLNLQTGATDVATNLEPRDSKTLQGNKDYSLLINSVMAAVWYLGIDVKTPPFNDKRVRQAMSYLLDRKRIVETQLFYGEPIVLPWDKTSPAYSADLAAKQEYNPDKAKALIAQAGVAANTPMTITVVAGQPSSLALAEMMQAELSKVGMKASVEKLGTAEYVAKLNKGEFGGLWFSSVGYMHMSPSTLFVMSFQYRVPNSSNFDSPDYRKLIADILKTADEAELKKLYRQVNELWLDESFVIPLASVEKPTVTASSVKGLKINRSGRPLLIDAWKSK